MRTDCASRLLLVLTIVLLPACATAYKDRLRPLAPKVQSMSSDLDALSLSLVELESRVTRDIDHNEGPAFRKGLSSVREKITQLRETVAALKDLADKMGPSGEPYITDSADPQKKIKYQEFLAETLALIAPHKPLRTESKVCYSEPTDVEATNSHGSCANMAGSSLPRDVSTLLPDLESRWTYLELLEGMVNAYQLRYEDESVILKYTVGRPSGAPSDTIVKVTVTKAEDAKKDEQQKREQFLTKYIDTAAPLLEEQRKRIFEKLQVLIQKVE